MLAGLLALAGAAQGAVEDPAIGDMPKKDRAIYDGVRHDTKLPVIGPIAIVKGPPGILEAKFTVRYPRIVKPGVDAIVRGRAELQVFRKRARNGVLEGRIQDVVRTGRLVGGGGEVEYGIELSQPASDWIAKLKKKDAARLVTVDADLLVDVNRDGKVDHDRSAAATVRYSRTRRGASASAPNNSIFLIMVNATGQPIYNISTPMICMYEREYGSDLSGFNYQPFGILPAGATHASIVAADSSAFDSPEFQSDTQGMYEAFQAMQLGQEVLEEVTDDLPYLALVQDLSRLVSGCDGNASMFMFSAALARHDEGLTQGVPSSTAGWVMSKDGNYGNFIEPIDSAVSAAKQQQYSEALLGGGPPTKWGWSPWWELVEEENVNPTSQVLYPAAYQWLTYESPQVECRTKRGKVEWPSQALIGDHGLSWKLTPIGGDGYELEVYRSGFENGWSGGNPANKELVGNTSTPPWSETYPTSYCGPGW
jgi:hypothetical protein